MPQRLLPVILSFVILAAHFLRDGTLPLLVASLAVPLVLIIRKPWAPRIVQLALLLAAAEWIRTGVAIAQIRAAHGGPWLRMALILGAVALLALVSALLLQSRRVRKVYDSRLESPEPRP